MAYQALSAIGTWYFRCDYVMNWPQKLLELNNAQWLLWPSWTRSSFTGDEAGLLYRPVFPRHKIDGTACKNVTDFGAFSG